MATRQELVSAIQAASKAIDHMADAVKELFGGRVAALQVIHSDDRILEILLAHEYHAMNVLGDILNECDAVTDEDEQLTDHVYEEVRRALGQEQPATP